MLRAKQGSARAMRCSKGVVALRARAWDVLQYALPQEVVSPRAASGAAARSADACGFSRIRCSIPLLVILVDVGRP